MSLEAIQMDESQLGHVRMKAAATALVLSSIFVENGSLELLLVIAALILFTIADRG